MTLGRFFRDYVYIPLGGSRCRKNRLILNLMIVWLITGLWHGNGLNYLLWGAVLGLFIMLEKLFYGERLKKLPVLRNLYVLFLIPLTWVIFAITDLHQLLIYFGRLFPVFGGTGIAVSAVTALSLPASNRPGCRLILSITYKATSKLITAASKVPPSRPTAGKMA